MAKHNSVSRSLQIISRAQGWDPNEIVDNRRPDSNRPEYEQYPSMKPFPAIDTTFPRENIFEADTCAIPKGAYDTSYPCPDPGVDTPTSFRTPALRENQENGTNASDPFVGLGDEFGMGKRR